LSSSESEEGGGSRLGKWKWPVIIIALVIILVVVGEVFYSFNCVFVNPPYGAGGGGC
jgi:hypothetical protein